MDIRKKVIKFICHEMDEVMNTVPVILHIIRKQMEMIADAIEKDQKIDLVQLHLISSLCEGMIFCTTLGRNLIMLLKDIDELKDFYSVDPFVQLLDDSEAVYNRTVEAVKEMTDNLENYDT